MFLNIIIAIIIIIGFVIWYNWQMAEKNRINRISGEKQQAEDLRREASNRSREDERITKNQQERRLRQEQEADAGKVREERDSREKELRQKIEDRKEHEAEEEQRKVDNEKTA